MKPELSTESTPEQMVVHLSRLYSAVEKWRSLVDRHLRGQRDASQYALQRSRHSSREQPPKAASGCHGRGIGAGVFFVCLFF